MCHGRVSCEAIVVIKVPLPSQFRAESLGLTSSQHWQKENLSKAHAKQLSPAFAHTIAEAWSLVQPFVVHNGRNGMARVKCSPPPAMKHREYSPPGQ